MSKNKKQRTPRSSGFSILEVLQGQVPVVEDTVEILECPHLDTSPLQVLKQAKFRKERKEGKEQELPDSIFEATIQAEQKVSLLLYDYLGQKLKSLADKTLEVNFPWRLRVGGLPGFRNLLLPAMHTTYGIPYVPASSLKGVVREWAEQQDDTIRSQVRSMLGYLDMQAKEDKASLGKVQFLDAFPTGKCLSIDLANPQWHWPKQKKIYNPELPIEYNPQPHALLSLENATLIIGLKATQLGSKEDVDTVAAWLEEALKYGLGSRISGGYGCAKGNVKKTRLSREYPFQFWSQGMYGYSTTNPEFRPVAVRGVMRYWFRAIALSLYDPKTVQILEGKLFGTIEPKAIRGSLRISIEAIEHGLNPFRISGKIRLEASSEKHLVFAQALLNLASSLSGCGRGSRRPLHWNNGRLRGCHWEIGDIAIAMTGEAWSKLLKEVRLTLQAVQEEFEDLQPKKPRRMNSEHRSQDVLDISTHIYLLKSPKLKHPKDVQDERWSTEGSKYQITGEGLEFLYDNDNYKGKSMENPGNPNVGGAVTKKGGIPSFVLIKSIFPAVNDPYQVVTVFDVDGHPDRKAFTDAINERYIKKKGGIQVWPPTC